MKKLLTLITILLIISCGYKIRVKVTEKFDDGKKKTVMKFVDEGVTEQLIEKLEYSQSGDTIIWENYNKNGEKNGMWKTPISSGVFLNGEKDGKWIGWFGKIKSEGNYKDGEELNGRTFSYYENGQIRNKTNYKDGKKDGKTIYYNYNKDGSIKEY